MGGDIAALELDCSSARHYNVISTDKIEESHIFEVQTDVFYRPQFLLYF